MTILDRLTSLRRRECLHACADSLSTSPSLSLLPPPLLLQDPFICERCPHIFFAGGQKVRSHWTPTGPPQSSSTPDT
eukprot:1187240-Rhodomonas_salina.1